MEFTKTGLRLVDVSKGKSKKGNTLLFVELHDSATLKNEKFMASSIEDGIKKMDEVDITLYVSNGFVTVDVYSG